MHGYIKKLNDMKLLWYSNIFTPFLAIALFIYTYNFVFTSPNCFSQHQCINNYKTRLLSSDTVNAQWKHYVSTLSTVTGPVC